MKIINNFSVHTAVIGALLAISTGCGLADKVKGRDMKSTSPAAPSGPTYAEVDAILQDKCAVCHSDPAVNKYVFVGHQDVLKADAQLVANAISATDPRKRMPMQRKTTPLTDDEKTALLVYLGKQAPAANASVPDFTKDIAPITEAKCAPCHADASPIQPHFVGHEDVFQANGNVIAGKITDTDVDAAMPPPAATKTLSDAEKATIIQFLGVTPQQ